MTHELPAQLGPGYAACTTEAELFAKFCEWLRAGSSEVLTRAQAAELAGFRDASAFHRWARRNRVTPASRGRWSRSQIKLALEREGRRRA